MKNNEKAIQNLGGILSLWTKEGEGILALQMVVAAINKNLQELQNEKG